MFKKKTVFILGAGASWHYGYPTGEELVKAVKEKAIQIEKTLQSPFIVSNGSAKDPLIYQPFFPQHFQNPQNDLLSAANDFKKRITQANPLVIDDFLGRSTKRIADFGKMLIAMVLHDCKNNSRDSNENDDWIRYIVQQLTVDCKQPEDLLANQVTFVTFNYDLSLETRLHQALSNYQWFADKDATNRFFAPGRFHHVYGQLYNFDPKQPNGPLNIYKNTFPLANDIDRAYDAAQTIHTIAPVEKKIDPEIPKAIADAEYLYFLGYGFDRRNNGLLGLGQRPKKSPRQHVHFTNYGNYNKVSKQVDMLYHLSGQSVVGTNFQADSYLALEYSYHIEKSIKSVYDALAQDFDWPD